jgi:hypothetical protein
MEGLWPMTFLNAAWEGEAMGTILLGFKLEPVMDVIPALACTLTWMWHSPFFFDTNFLCKSQTDI